MAGKNQSIYGHCCHLSELLIIFFMDLSVLHFQIVFSLLPHSRHWRAVMEPLMYWVSFVSRLHSDFKHPDFRAPALCAIPPRANLVSYSHTSCLLNSAKLFWVCNQSNMSFFFFLQEKLLGVGIDISLIFFHVSYKSNHC